jgi:hypothetical protein
MRVAKAHSFEIGLPTKNPLMGCKLEFHCGNMEYQRYQYEYSTVQYSTVQYSTVQFSTIQYSTVQYEIRPVGSIEACCFYAVS